MRYEIFILPIAASDLNNWLSPVCGLLLLIIEPKLGMGAKDERQKYSPSGEAGFARGMILLTHSGLRGPAGRGSGRVHPGDGFHALERGIGNQTRVWFHPTGPHIRVPDRHQQAN